MPPPGPRPEADVRGLSAEDRHRLERTLELALRGRGRVHPNPMVGCVVVRDGTVVGEGWHTRYGGPHAEVHALGEAGERAKDATAYVSLEPCAHVGKTPPCTDALREAGVARVVYGAPDPGRESSGGGARLRDAGLEVVGPVWSETEGRALNPAFWHLARHQGPYVAVKLAVSLDGGIAAAPGERTRLTGDEAEAEVHRLRSEHRAVMVGGRTARVDDPRLTVRHAEAPEEPPVRIVLDGGAELPSDGTLAATTSEAPVLLFCAPDAPSGRVRALEARGVEIERVARGPSGLDLEEVLASCRERGLDAILCEGGGRLASALVREGLAHRLFLLMALLTLGPGAVPAFPDPVPGEVWRRWRPAPPVRVLGRDTLVTWERA